MMNEQAHDILRALMSPLHYAKYEGQPPRPHPFAQGGTWIIDSKGGDQYAVVYGLDALYEGSEPDFEEVEI